MKLSAQEIDRLVADSSPRNRNIRAAEDYAEGNHARQLELIKNFATANSQAQARTGEVLPPPPKSLATTVYGPNDFGIPHDEDEDSDFGAPRPSGEEAPASSSVNPIPRALAGADLSSINGRADLVYALTQNLPNNELGLPKILFSPDLLDWTLFASNSPEGSDVLGRYQMMQEMLDSATLYLSYDEGFPSLPSGEPLWAKLPFESPDSYSAFTSYVEQVGVRQTSKLIAIPHDRVLEWYHTNYWAIRAKSFDMMSSVHAARKREQRILSCEDNHYLEADRLFAKITAFGAEVDWSTLKDPETYVNVLEKVVKLQRLALNLQQNSQRNEIKTESVEVALRKLAQHEGPDLKMRDDGVDVRQLLRNPEALASAQELIVRMTKTTSHSSQDSDSDSGG